METALPGAQADIGSHDSVLTCVQKTERITAIVPLAIMVICVAPPVLGNLIHLSVAGALLNGFLCFLISGLLIKGVKAFILTPFQNFRYKKAAEQLGAEIQAGNSSVLQKRIWWQETPGALAITRQGEVIVMDQKSDYRKRYLRADQIVGVQVEREATHITNTRHGGRFTIGGLSRSGLFGGYTFGGRSRSITRTVETAFLELQYQLDPNGVTYMTIVPFGNARREADALCTTIRRMARLSQAQL
ncbi:hypothetical protein [Komagataeibacter intermedius]|uniref:Uncharacterized protein n=1 Tax=Komagataeibacter intermedius AF2 TaxID=1458464 RepID=A0A0N0MG92_9PROT|nr:hypothetical protein [Komagataeibacter intermedius]KPH88486.1 hypothetical protein GLUCOINTEAF2_0203817 [Komagataeibacter intermedius AF2]